MFLNCDSVLYQSIIGEERIMKKVFLIILCYFTMLISFTSLNAQELDVTTETRTIGPGQTKIIDINVDGRININSAGHQEIWAEGMFADFFGCFS